MMTKVEQFLATIDVNTMEGMEAARAELNRLMADDDKEGFAELYDRLWGGPAEVALVGFPDPEDGWGEGEPGDASVRGECSDGTCAFCGRSVNSPLCCANRR